MVVRKSEPKREPKRLQGVPQEAREIMEQDETAVYDPVGDYPEAPKR
jgi:hypothetical protein